MSFIKNKKQVEEFQDESLAPDKFLQPFMYKNWEIIGNIIKFNESKHLHDKSKPLSEFVHRFAKNFSGVIGVLIVLFLVSLALIIPLFSNNPTELRADETDKIFFHQGKDSFFIFGTDSKGRDVWSFLWFGLRYSLGIAIIVTFFDVILGVTFGILMGQFDRFDRFMTFIIKIVSNVPSILILIMITVALEPSFWVIVLAFSMFGWIGMAMQIRAQVKRARNFSWVTASKLLGTPKIKILKNYFPVILPILITQLVFTIPGAILGETSLAFIGLSIINSPTLGTMIADGALQISSAPRYVLIPSFLLILLTTSIQFIGSSIQDSLRRQR